MRKIWQLHIHHSVNPSYKNFNGKNHKQLFNWIKNYHIKHNGWSDIGYHFIIFPDGQIVDGRPIEKTPASIKGYNKGAIAICLIGNFDKDDITIRQFYFLLELSVELVKKYNIKIDNIYFHRELNNKKTCPGLKIDKDRFIRQLEIMLL